MANTTPNTTPNLRNQTSSCQECGKNPWKYRCPGCSILTCSLPCVKSHKQSTSCTGQKDKSEIVPLSRFDDNLLLSDYNFLEDAKRVAEAAGRARIGIGSSYRFKLPKHLNMLRNAANRRSTRLLILPSGMSRRGKNCSCYDRRKNSIFWTIEWRFHSTNVILMDHRVSEYTNICSVFQKHLQPSPWNHPLKAFCDENVEDLMFFLQKDPKKGIKSPFRKIDIKSPIGQQMTDVVIVEYPIIYVFLPSHKYNFEVDESAKVYTVKSKFIEEPQPVHSPKGIVFKEEEIADGNSSDPQVLDLMQYRKTESCDGIHIPIETAIVDKVPTTVDMRISGVSNESWRLISCNNVRENKMAIDVHSEDTTSLISHFDFEQDLKDAYSDLIGELNPDDLLCLDGLYSDEEVVDGKDDVCIGLQQEELEEGEIPS